MSGEGTAASERTELARALVGRVVGGRWTLTRVLGTGGMASVFEARHRNGRRAALKILHPAVAAQKTARLRFLSEGYAANKVEHPGAVLILDDGEDGDLVFLVMELLEGRSLSDRLAEEGPLAPAEVVRVATAVLEVLAEAHDRGVVHRDIKPSNVFQLTNGTIKVLDFGVAQVREPGSMALTDSGVAVGTPAFMAPEQAAGRSDEVGAPTDVWAVGATMFRLLTGSYVHDARTPNAAIVAAATTPARRVASLRPDVPSAIQAVVDRALAFAQDDRYPNARAMQRALALATGVPESILTPEDTATMTDRAPAGVRREPKRRAPVLLWALGGMILAVVVYFVTFELRQFSGAAPPASIVAEPVPTPLGAPAIPAADPVVATPGVPASAAAPSAASAPTPSAVVRSVAPRPAAARPEKPRLSTKDDTLIDTRQ